MAAANAPVDVKELSGAYVFVVDVPGLRNTDIKVQIENDTTLKISGERRRESAEEIDVEQGQSVVDGGDRGGNHHHHHHQQQQQQQQHVKYVRVERPAGRFMRKFNLPAHLDLDAISAACQQGVLTVVVPKMPAPEPHKPRTFEVPVGSAPSS